MYTRPSTQDALLHDLSGAVGPVPVPLDPAGKVFTYLFSSVVQLNKIISLACNAVTELISDVRVLQHMDQSMVRHLLNSSLQTPFIFSIHSITPPLFSKLIITVPRPPSLLLEDPWVAILISSVILSCLHLHSSSPIWEVCPLMR